MRQRHLGTIIHAVDLAECEVRVANILEDNLQGGISVHCDAHSVLFAKQFRGFALHGSLPVMLKVSQLATVVALKLCDVGILTVR